MHVVMASFPYSRMSDESAGKEAFEESSRLEETNLRSRIFGADVQTKSLPPCDMKMIGKESGESWTIGLFDGSFGKREVEAYDADCFFLG